MPRFFKFILYAIAAIILVGCASSKKSAVPRNLEMIYDPLSSSLHPRYSVYNNTDSSSVVVGEIISHELLYNNAVDENRLTARLKVKCNLYDLDKKERITDSITAQFVFEKKPSKKYNLVEIPLKSFKGNKYVLEIITEDQNRNSNQYTFLKLDRIEGATLCNFGFRDTLSNKLMVNPDINNWNFTIDNYKYDFDSLNVFFFKKSMHIPLPPNQNDSLNYNFITEDSSWVCYLDSVKYENFEKEGSYYFTLNDKPIKGFVLNQFGDLFPNINKPEDLIKPLQYLGLQDTISCSDSLGKSTKYTVDKFWLNIAQNVDRSRDLVKLFYNRVVNANKYFTSFTEGWQTDRGMIYIVYGIPDYIFKSDTEEKWIYSPIDLGPGFSFTFTYYENPFSLNHYVLKREKLKDTGWDSVIRMWEKGEIIYYQK